MQKQLLSMKIDIQFSDNQEWFDKITYSEKQVSLQNENGLRKQVGICSGPLDLGEPWFKRANGHLISED